MHLYAVGGAGETERKKTPKAPSDVEPVIPNGNDLKEKPLTEKQNDKLDKLVAMLSEQSGDTLIPDPDDRKTFFPIGKRIGENVLMKPFYQGMKIEGVYASDLATSDRFLEETEQIGIDQLLMIRLAKHLGSAPSKPQSKNDSEISNQRPVARTAARQCAEDLRNFIRNH